ncbi:ANTH-domain-containing protein [Thelephora terrestris]|uniref:ANTH-domain-containing protein n=1 Tax=Thelephora terrestris TaxID=56493 RepID=A0A9P6L0W8_9AGAM|nr:ANTH-domain-containing protein [Thelephora terrestris]
MSSFDKVVKAACKPKAAVPKPKYLDALIAATYSEDGSVHDVCKALAPKFKEPNAIVVFKALLTLHKIIRDGATDNILAYLSSGDVLRLKNVAAPNWEGGLFTKHPDPRRQDDKTDDLRPGYNAPENLSNYATYLDTRIRAFRDLKHDAIRVQSETNRDLRNSAAIEDDALRRNGAPLSDRRKTIIGRKLRIMTVEKGLLRETKVVQRMVDALCECRFYLDNLDDGMNIMALRMLVEDLLILFQACNEGVVNVLEHYFEMSKVDATEALRLYRRFCKQAEKVVEFLGVAKKLQNLLNVPIPNLKHAPVSLVGSLEEYLNDPHFEQNRIEYKANKEAADKGTRNGGQSRGVTKKLDEPTPKQSGLSSPPPSTSNPPPKTSDATKAMQDFFSAIEEEQTTIFNPQTGSPSTVFFQQQPPAFNPFSQGGAFGTSPFQQPFGVQPQQTGFFVPQQTGFPAQSGYNPFGQHLQPQPTATPIHPQMTAINPFRQNTLDGTNGVHTQATGFNPSPFGPLPTNPSPFGPSPTYQGTSPFPVFVQNPEQQQQIPFNSASPFNTAQQPNTHSPFTLPHQIQQQLSQPPPLPQHPMNNMSVPPRPASAPLKTSSPEPIKPLVAQQTGSRNPFGIPTAPPPPVPKVPTLMELAMSKQQQLRQMQQQQQQPQNGQLGQASLTTSNPSTGSAMSSVASDFASLNFGNNKPVASSLSPQMTSTTNSSFSTDTLFSVSTQQTGATTSTVPSISVQPTGGLTSHTTGLGTFTGLKTFKPSSSFGASLLESLPPIPGSGPTTPAVTSETQGQLGSPPVSTVSSPGPTTTSSTTFGGVGGLGTPGLNLGLGNQNQPNGLNSTFGGSGLNTQPTGFGALNAQQPLTTGLGSGIGTGFSTTGFGSNLSTTTGTGSGGVGVGLGPQTNDVQETANPFRVMTMFPSSTFPPRLGGGLGPNPGFGGGLGGFNGTPFGQNPNTQPQPQQQQQGSLI